MERRSNPLPQVVIEPDDYHGDFLDGLMANHEIISARKKEASVSEIDPYEEIVIFSSNDNALETIGADNFRGFREFPVEVGADNFRAKFEAK